MDLNILLILLERYGMQVKDTKITCKELYGEWDMPVGFAIRLVDSKTEICVESAYELPDIPKHKRFFGLGANNDYVVIPTKIIIRTGPLSIKTIPYEDFYKTIV